MKKKNLAKKYFIIISATFILGLIFAYGTRLVHFYLKENKNINSDETGEKVNYFSDILENTINVTDSNGGLYVDKENYMYKYAAEDNYLFYSGHLWRILRINENKTITMVSNEAISLFNIKYEENDYLNDFLNEFYDKLNHDYLVPFKACDDQINEGGSVTCNNENEVNISLLDLYNYNKAGNGKSFLNDGTSYWLANKNAEGSYLYINNEGSISVGNDIAHEIRPVVTLKDKIKLISGEGTEESPYIIDERNISKINEVLTGEYIKYNDSLWRVLEITEKSVKAIKTTCILDKEECLNHRFGSSITYLNGSLYRYLNTTYLKSLENSDFIVKDVFYNGNYTNYDFRELKNNNIEAFIGLPKIGDYYAQNNYGSYLITPNVIETVYTVNEDGNYYLVNPSKELNIYPVINFDLELNIIAGNGSIDNPYELSR